MESLSDLSAAFLDDEISDTQLRDLCQRLGDQPADVDEFVLDCFVHNELGERFAAERIELEVQSIIDRELSAAAAGPETRPTNSAPHSAVAHRELPPVRRPWFNRFARTISWSRHPSYFSAAVLLIGLSSWLMLLAIVTTRSERPVAERSAGVHRDVVARLVWTNGARWDGFVPDGNGMMAGRKLALVSGVAEIQFVTGARVVLEGSSEFIIASRPTITDRTDLKVRASAEEAMLNRNNSGYLARGRLVARVADKDAKGFTITTPTAQIKDLGTEFAIGVARSGATSLHVYEGTVEVGGTHGLAVQVVRAGRSLRFTANVAGRVTASSVDSLEDRFVRADAARNVRASDVEWQPDAVRRPVWDGHVSKNQPDEDFRDAPTLLVKRDGARSVWNREAWLAFDLTGIEWDRLVDAELVLVTAPPVDKKTDPAPPPRWTFEVIGIDGNDANRIGVSRVTWNTTRNAKGESLAEFGFTHAAGAGHTVRSGGAALVWFLRQSKGRPVVLVIRRITDTAHRLSGFASDEQGESGPFLRFRYAGEPAG